jgi:hypothetical protein
MASVFTGAGAQTARVCASATQPLPSQRLSFSEVCEDFVHRETCTKMQSKNMGKFISGQKTRLLMSSIVRETFVNILEGFGIWKPIWMEKTRSL